MEANAISQGQSFLRVFSSKVLLIQVQKWKYSESCTQQTPNFLCCPNEFMKQCGQATQLTYKQETDVFLNKTIGNCYNCLLSIWNKTTQEKYESNSTRKPWWHTKKLACKARNAKEILQELTLTILAGFWLTAIISFKFVLPLSFKDRAETSGWWHTHMCYIMKMRSSDYLCLLTTIGFQITSSLHYILVSFSVHATIKLQARTKWMLKRNIF